MQPCLPPCSPTYHRAALHTTVRCSHAGATGGQQCRPGAWLHLLLASTVARTTMTLMSPLVTGVHHHRGLRRHGGGAPLMGGVGYAWWPGTCTDAWWLVGLQGCTAAGWCLFYYRHSLANFLDWPLIFRANPSRRFLGQVVPRAFLEQGIFSSFI